MSSLRRTTSAGSTLATTRRMASVWTELRRDPRAQRDPLDLAREQRMAARRSQRAEKWGEALARVKGLGSDLAVLTVSLSLWALVVYAANQLFWAVLSGAYFATIFNFLARYLVGTAILACLWTAWAQWTASFFSSAPPPRPRQSAVLHPFHGLVARRQRMTSSPSLHSRTLHPKP